MRGQVSQTHAIGRQHAAQGMRKDRGHAECVGDHAGMLTARTAKHGQRILRDVMAALHRDALDGLSHVAHRNMEETFCQTLG